MKFFSIWLLSIFLSQTVTGQTSPEEITKNFIKEHKVWNDNAFQLHDLNNPLAHNIAEKEYKALIEKYCVPNKVYQNLAFGNPSTHSPEEETIMKSKINQNKAIVETKFKDKNFDYLINYYEYHFVLTNGTWLLEEVYFIDDEGKYPGL
ncbi:NTF2 fold immunity protein [Flavobacterium sp.]